MKLKTTEHAEQAAFVRAMALQFPKESELLFAIPNGAVLGGKNKYALMNKLKSEGFKNGVPDMFLAICGDAPYHGLFLEFKSATGRCTDEQIIWQAKLKAEGYAVAVVRSAEEALETVKKHLKGEL